MPAILVAACTPDAVLDVIFSVALRSLPSCLRLVAIVRMDRLKPTQTQAGRKIQAGEVRPLRAGPSALSVGFGAENQLGNICGEYPKPLLAFAKLFLSAMLACSVARYLYESGVPVSQRHQKARRPETAAILAHLPAFVLRPASSNCGAAFLCSRL